ncbi:MAG: hypothetical protein AB1724_16260 [Thermodesulfobacteriota bacterium]
MNYETTLAALNLQAVLPNLMDLVRHDPTAAAIAASRDICIQFLVRGGPAAYVAFKNGACTVENGQRADADVKLWFASCRHLNRMFKNQANPVPIKGLTRIGYLTKEFKKITARMEHFLTPNDNALAQPDYMALNTLLTLNTAARAICILVEGDKAARNVAAGMPDGTLLLKVLPDGPAAGITFRNRRATMTAGETEKPSALMLMKDLKTANDLLNQKLDPFAAIALGDVRIWGQTPMIDCLDLILERIPHYLQP